MTAPTPVICLAHGSRHPLADGVVGDIARGLTAAGGPPAAEAFLDFSPRTPLNAARMLAAAGHDRAVVVPLLFTSAFHMTEDVPAAVRDMARGTGMDVRCAAGLGTGPDLARLLAGVARGLAAGEPGGVRPGAVVLYSVGSTRPGANAAVGRLARAVGAELGVAGSAVVATGTPAARLRGEVGPVALVDRVRRSAAPTVVLPLFVAPGTLWDRAVEALDALPAAGVPVLTGAPLGTRVVPLVRERAAAALTGTAPTGSPGQRVAS
ncbi:sirohydrochlorin chelatase [Corynebacterium bovis]|uniref:sirohydrochlorin chelatase n=1 Tax=Corynebacterium bovis TaxID=36808 RepID=UPI002449439A|nr:sirohydrochlorin chelatase [Corynebacterium bovis]MDH2456452.1 sirohydrochlorin chelatase [Corynebacterium bovis]